MVSSSHFGYSGRFLAIRNYFDLCSWEIWNVWKFLWNAIRMQFQWKLSDTVVKNFDETLQNKSKQTHIDQVHRTICIDLYLFIVCGCFVVSLLLWWWFSIVSQDPLTYVNWMKNLWEIVELFLFKNVSLFCVVSFAVLIFCFCLNFIYFLVN